MSYFIIQWFNYYPQGTSVHHKSFTDQGRARAFAKALTLKDIQTVPEFDFTSEWIKVYGGGQKLKKTPVKNEAWEKFQEENPNFWWDTTEHCFRLQEYLPHGISLYEGELY